MTTRATDPFLLQTMGSDAVLRVNTAFIEHFGYDESDFSDKSIAARVHADDRSRFMAILADGGEAMARLEHEDGSWSEMEWRAWVACGASAVALLGRLARPALERRPSGSTNLASPGMQQTLDAMARIAEAKNPGMKCSILLVDKAGEYVVGGAGPSLPCEYNQAVEGLRIGPAVGSCGTAAFWNVPVVVEDIAKDPLWRHLREAAALAGVCACWSHPVTKLNGEVLGAMALYAHEPSRPTPSQMDGLEIAAQMVGLAIEREALEEQLRQAAKMEALGVLAGGIAHDFNNLLAAILGNAELAQFRAEAGEGVAEPLEEVIKASVTASELCDRMLAFAGRGVATKAAVELSELVREVGNLMQAAISKKISLEFKLADRACRLDADRGQISQVLMNLLTNASEAIGSERGRVEVTTTRGEFTRGELEEMFPGADLLPGEYVRLRVRDDGAGMSPATQKRMFDPFFTTKKSGRGLGLAAVRGIVENHAGGIDVASTVGNGTTVTVGFPVGVAPRATSDVPQSAYGHTPLRILVVDDEQSVREVMVKHLAEAGHTVVAAGDGDEALEVFERDQEFDCILLDYSLPTLDGIEVFRRMHDLRPDVRAILMSGFTEQETMDRFDGEPLVGFLHKPTRMRVVLEKIAEVGQRSRQSIGAAREE